MSTQFTLSLALFLLKPDFSLCIFGYSWRYIDAVQCRHKLWLDRFFECPHEHDSSNDDIFTIEKWIRIHKIEFAIPYHIKLKLLPCEGFGPDAIEYRYELIRKDVLCLFVGKCIDIWNQNMRIVHVCEDIRLIVSDDEYIP